MKLIVSILCVVSALVCSVESAECSGFDGDPIYEHSFETNDVEFLAVRPFYSRIDDPQNERWRCDYLWPVYTRKGFMDETYSRFLFFGYSNDFSSETKRHRHWILPIYFKGTDKNDENYFAIFPLGGTLNEFLGRDKIMFVLFPIYAKSQVNDVHTKSVLWPIYSKTQGSKVDRMRVWPFYGRSEREGEYRRKFVMWPIYSSVEYTGERNPGGGFVLVPIYGHVKTERSETHWWVAPFFRHTVSADQTIVHWPWPFVQLADGDMYKRYLWPIYGRKTLGAEKKQFFLWPLIWNNQVKYLHYNMHRRSVIPFFYSTKQVVTTPTPEHAEGDVQDRYWKLWPLMSWERGEGDSRFRTLDLWPLRNTPGIERNWAPYWTLYRRMNEDGEVAHHLLWGLYRQRRSEEQFEWSLLKGLVGYKKNQNNRSFRFLFMWFGEEEQP